MDQQWENYSVECVDIYLGFIEQYDNKPPRLSNTIG